MKEAVLDQNTQVATTKEVVIKLTSGWFTDEPTSKNSSLKLADLSIPGFPKAGDAVMGFHAEFAVMGGSYLFSLEKSLKKDCKIATIEVAFSSETQTSYADILKTDKEYWAGAKCLHLGKAKKHLKQRVADLVSDYHLKSGVDPEIVRDAEIAGFDALLNLDPAAITTLFKSKDFPNLEMVITAIYPVGVDLNKFRGRAPNIAIIKKSLIRSVTIDDIFDHKVSLR